MFLRSPLRRSGSFDEPDVPKGFVGHIVCNSLRIIIWALRMAAEVNSFIAASASLCSF